MNKSLYKLTNKRRCTGILIKNCAILEFPEESDFQEIDAILDIFDFKNRLIDLRLIIPLEAA